MAAIATIESILRKYPREYVECRAFGHNWENLSGLVKHDYFSTVRGKKSYCESCEMVRYRWYLSTGKRFGPNSYDAPEGYSLHLDDYKDLDRLPTLEEWRGLALKRAGFRTSPNVETLSQKTRVRKSA